MARRGPEGRWDGNVFLGVDWTARRRIGADGWDPGRPSPLMGFDQTLSFDRLLYGRDGGEIGHGARPDGETER